MAAVLTGARTRVTLTPPRLANRGILNAARVVPSTGHDLLGVEALVDWCGPFASRWEEEWCVTAIATQCPTITPLADGGKVFEDRTEWIEGDPIVVYAGSDCPTDTLAQREDKAARALTYGEGPALDIAILEWLDAQWAADAENPPAGFAYNVECGIGAMDALIGGNYGGEGMVWLPLPVLAPAVGAGVLLRDLDGGWRTPGDNRVAAVLAREPIEPATTAYAAYATGAVTILQGPVSTYSVPPMIASDGTCAPARALAERVYVPLVECDIFKFSLTCCGCGSTP